MCLCARICMCVCACVIIRMQLCLLQRLLDLDGGWIYGMHAVINSVNWIIEFFTSSCAFCPVGRGWYTVSMFAAFESLRVTIHFLLRHSLHCFKSMESIINQYLHCTIVQLSNLSQIQPNHQLVIWIHIDQGL